MNDDFPNGKCEGSLRGECMKGIDLFAKNYLFDSWVGFLIATDILR